MRFSSLLFCFKIRPVSAAPHSSWQLLLPTPAANVAAAARVARAGRSVCLQWCCSTARGSTVMLSKWCWGPRASTGVTLTLWGLFDLTDPFSTHCLQAHLAAQWGQGVLLCKLCCHCRALVVTSTGAQPATPAVPQAVTVLQDGSCSTATCLVSELIASSAAALAAQAAAVMTVSFAFT